MKEMKEQAQQESGGRLTGEGAERARPRDGDVPDALKGQPAAEPGRGRDSSSERLRHST